MEGGKEACDDSSNGDNLERPGLVYLRMIVIGMLWTGRVERECVWVGLIIDLE